MRLSGFFGSTVAAVLAGGLSVWVVTQAFGQVLIVGNDEKQGWDENLKPTFNEPGHDTLSLIDISKPETPRRGHITMINSVVRPPTNLTIRPSGEIALVAGKQLSGMAISPNGGLEPVANRADRGLGAFDQRHGQLRCRRQRGLGQTTKDVKKRLQRHGPEVVFGKASQGDDAFVVGPLDELFHQPRLAHPRRR